MICYLQLTSWLLFIFLCSFFCSQIPKWPLCFKDLFDQKFDDQNPQPLFCSLDTLKIRSRRKDRGGSHDESHSGESRERNYAAIGVEGGPWRFEDLLGTFVRKYFGILVQVEVIMNDGTGSYGVFEWVDVTNIQQHGVI